MYIVGPLPSRVNLLGEMVPHNLGGVKRFACLSSHSGWD